MIQPSVIAIDGPSGAGKGTVARAIAAQLRWRHVDTGAMYRAVAWKAIRERVALEDESAVARLAAHSGLELNGPRVVIDGADVTDELRNADMDRAAAAVARLGLVRAALVRRQQELARAGSVVMEGRDIGTVVFPDAPVKIYLDADPAERAARRASDEHHQRPATSGVEEIRRELDERDQSDRTRTASPLTSAPDAVRIDTTGVPVEEVVRRVLEVIRERLPGAESV